MCGSTMSSAPSLTIVVTFFHLPGWHQGLVALTMRVDAERLHFVLLSATGRLPRKSDSSIIFHKNVFLPFNTLYNGHTLDKD